MGRCCVEWYFRPVWVDVGYKCLAQQQQSSSTPAAAQQYQHSSNKAAAGSAVAAAPPPLAAAAAAAASSSKKQQKHWEMMRTYKILMKIHSSWNFRRFPNRTRQAIISPVETLSYIERTQAFVWKHKHMSWSNLLITTLRFFHQNSLSRISRA